MNALLMKQYTAMALGVAVAACAPVPAATTDTAGPSPATIPRTDPGPAPAVTGIVAAPVLAGVDVLLREGAGPLAGRRVGLITNHTGRTADGRSTIDALHAHPDLDLVALFSPEHGIRGDIDAGGHVDNDIDARTGLTVHSLYGETREPTAAMLEGVDALVFDIQDIGTRYYTYVWTMTLAMKSAAEHGRRFVVLDRPNPIGGELVQGNVLDPEYATFVGLYPVPMRHGLTAGEMARYVNREFDIDADLHVVEADGWSRDLWYDATTLTWRPPSPNMPTLESATHYPGTCLFEGTNLSVGRGTDLAFSQIGAPWLDAAGLVTRMRARNLPGVAFEAIEFTPRSPADRKFDGERIAGVRLRVTDRQTYDPTVTAVALLVEIQRAHGDELRFAVSHFDRLAGTAFVRLGLLAGHDVERLTATWAAQRAAFLDQRAPYLLYE